MNVWKWILTLGCVFVITGSCLWIGGQITSSNSEEHLTQDEKNPNEQEEDETGLVVKPTPNEESDANKEEINQVEMLLSELTLEEKIAQMFIVALDDLTQIKNTTSANEQTKHSFESLSLGGFIIKKENIVNEQQLIDLNKGLIEMSKTKLGFIPFLGIDEEGGSIVRIADHPNFSIENVGPMADIGKTNDSEKAYDVGQTIGNYLHQYGFNINFAPDADVLLNDKNTVIGNRSFGSDPQLVADMVTNVIEGLHDEKMAATVKHFPGHGFTIEDSHEKIAISNRTLHEIKKCELLPFIAGIEAGVEFVMVGHLAYPNILNDLTPASLSPYFITELLRDELKFEGLVIMDAMNMGAITSTYKTEDAILKTINAGTDIILMTEDFHEAYQALLQAVRTGEISESRIDESVSRIITLKLQMEEKKLGQTKWEDLNEILLHVYHVMPGSSGCSLKSAKAGGELLDWLTMNPKIPLDELKMNSLKIIEDPENDMNDRKELREAWTSVYQDALKIIAGDEAMLTQVQDAGYTLKFKTYQINDLNMLNQVLQDLLPND